VTPNPTPVVTPPPTPEPPTPTPEPATPTPQPAPPNAEPRITSCALANFDVSFDGTSSTGATTYLWEFGDGDSSTEAVVTHTYAAAGVFTVRLTVSGPGGTDFEDLSPIVVPCL
jgi:PKD repeat protein